MKHCPVCKESYNDKWKRCLKDDASLDVIGQDPKTASLAASRDRELSTNRRERYKNVGGWLGLYIWALLIMGPIHFVLIVYTIITGSGPFIYPTDLPLPLNILYAVLAFAEIAAAILLLRPKISSVIAARVVMISWSLFRAVFIYMVWSRGPNEIFSAVIGFLTEFVWLLYFFFSKRVKIRYYPEPPAKTDTMTSMDSYLYKFKP